MTHAESKASERSQRDQEFKKRYPRAHVFFVGTIFDRSFTIEEAVAEELYKFPETINQDLPELKLLAERRDIPWLALQDVFNGTFYVPDEQSTWKMLDIIIDILEGRVKLNVYREVSPKYKPRKKTPEEEEFEGKHPQAYLFFLNNLCAYRGEGRIEDFLSRRPNGLKRSHESLQDMKQLFEKKDIPWQALRYVANIPENQMPDEQSAWRMLENLINILEKTNIDRGS